MNQPGLQKANGREPLGTVCEAQKPHAASKNSIHRSQNGSTATGFAKPFMQLTSRKRPFKLSLTGTGLPAIAAAEPSTSLSTVPLKRIFDDGSSSLCGLEIVHFDREPFQHFVILEETPQ